MPYKLKISEEEVRAELESMGFDNITDDAVEVFRRDLLKLIKSDLRKLRQEKVLEGSRDETTYMSPPTTIGRHSQGQKKTARPNVSTPVSLQKQTDPPKISSKDFRHLRGGSQASLQSEDDTTVESGYSDFESESSRPSYSSGQLSDSSTSISFSERGNRPRFTQVSTKKNGAYPSPSDSKEDSHRESQESAFDSHKVTEESSIDSHRGGFKDSASLPPKESVSETQVSVKPKKKPVKRQESLPSYPSQPDPVNLYHFYKAHWEKFKTPGEDPRSKLRWEVRTKLFYSS